MNFLRIRSTGPLCAAFELTGDRHLSRLAVLLGSAAEGTTLITGCSPLTDTETTIAACRALGVNIGVFSEQEGAAGLPANVTVLIKGRDFEFTRPPEVIDCQTSWPALCLLPALLMTRSFTTRITGGVIPRQIGETFVAAGAGITQHRTVGRIHYEVQGTLHPPPLHGVFSSGGELVKESCLLAAAQVHGLSRFTETVPLRNHMEHLLSVMGAEVESLPGEIRVRGFRGLRAATLHLPGDTDQVVAWMAAAAALPGSEVIIRRAGLNPLRSSAFKVLLRMGVKVTESVTGVCASEECGSVMVRGTALQSTTVESSETASLRATLPVLAVAASVAHGTTVLRVDPSDLHTSSRLWAIAGLLQAFGVPLREFVDALEITGSGGAPLRAGTFDCAGDTSLATAAAVAGLLSIGDTMLTNPGHLVACWPRCFTHCLTPLSASPFHLS